MRLAEFEGSQTTGGDGGKDPIEQAKGKIEETLRTGLDKYFSPELTNVFKERIKADKKTNTTTITIGNLPRDLTPDEKKEDKFKEWIQNSLGKDKITNKEIIQVEFPDKGVVIIIQLPISDLY